MKAAKAWARSHGFRYGKVDVSGSRAQYIRLRQHDPSEYRPSTFRTIPLDADETVKAVVGVPLRAAAATRPAGYDSRGPRQNPVRKSGKGEAAAAVSRGNSYLAEGRLDLARSALAQAQHLARAGYPAKWAQDLLGGDVAALRARVELAAEGTARANPFGKYRGVPYYHTAGVCRAHMPGGATEAFGASRGGKNGMMAFIDGYLDTARLTAKNPASRAAMLHHHLRDVEQAVARGKPEVARYLYREAAEYLPKKRHNGSAFAEHPGYDRPTEWAVSNRAGDNFGIYEARSENAAISAALAHFGVAPEDADPTLYAEPVPAGSILRYRRTRRNGAPRVRVPGLGIGVIVAQRPGGMVDVRLSSGNVVRKPASSLTPA